MLEGQIESLQQSAWELYRLAHNLNQDALTKLDIIHLKNIDDIPPSMNMSNIVNNIQEITDLLKNAIKFTS